MRGRQRHDERETGDVASIGTDESEPEDRLLGPRTEDIDAPEIRVMLRDPSEFEPHSPLTSERRIEEGPQEHRIGDRHATIHSDGFQHACLFRM